MRSTSLRRWLRGVGLSTFLAASASWAAPTLIGASDAGYSGGQHYYSIFFSVDSGYVCSNNGTYGSELVNQVVTNGVVIPSYYGPSGYSQYVCQVNVHAATGSGNQYLSFYWYQNGGWVGFLSDGIQLNF